MYYKSEREEAEIKLLLEIKGCERNKIKDCERKNDISRVKNHNMKSKRDCIVKARYEIEERYEYQTSVQNKSTNRSFFFNKHYFKYYFGSKNMILVQTIPNDTKLVSQRK